jgi:DNA helicase HerA-like ATPase
METHEKIKLKVYEPKNNIDLKKTILPSQIPKPRFAISIIGTTGSGKSNLIKNFIFNLYKCYFDEIYILIGSLDDLDEYTDLGENTKCQLWNKKKGQLYKTKKIPLSEKMVIENDVDEDELQELYTTLEEEQYKKQKRIRSLWIFDDKITSGLFKKAGNGGVINKLLVQGRHINASVIFTSQKYRMLPQNARANNITHLILFNGLSKQEMDIIAQEHSGHLAKDDFIKLYYDTTKEKYSFMVVNIMESREKRFQNSQFEYIDVGHKNISP